MASNLEIMHELARRDALPPHLAEIYGEARRRGLFEDHGEAGLKALQAQGAGRLGEIGPVEAAARGASQGLTFNWGDELYGFGKNLPKLATDGVDAYWDAAKKDTAAVRDNNARAQEQNPKAFMGGLLGGALAPLAASYVMTGATGGAAAPAAGATTGRLASILASPVARGVRAGGIYGAIGGAGAAETPVDADRYEVADKTATGVLHGGLLGGMIGGALPIVGDNIVSPVLRNLITKPSQALFNPDRFAASKVAEAIQRGNKGLTTQDIAAKAAQQSQNAPNTVLADVGGEPTRDLMRAALNQPNSETTGFKKFLDARQKNQYKAIEDGMIKPNFGNVDEYEQVMNKILTDRNAAAGPAFKEAFSGDFRVHPDLYNIIETRPDIFGPTSKFFKNVRADIQAEKGLAPSYMEGQAPSDLSMGELAHRFKVQLQNAIDFSATPAGKLDNSSAANMSQGALKSLHAQYMAALGKSEGEGASKYFSAVKQYGDDSDIARALKYGYEHGKGETPQGMDEFLDGAGSHAKSAYRLGLGRAKADANLVGRYGTDRIARDWDSPLVDEQLKRIMGTPPPPGSGGMSPLDRLQGVKEALQEQSATRAAATGNSTTAKQLLAAQDATKDTDQVIQGAKAAAGAAGGNFAPMMQMAQQRLQRIAGMNPRVAAEVLRLSQRPAGNFGTTAGWELDPAIRSLIDQQAAWAAQKPAMFQAATRGLLGPINTERGRD